MSGLLTATLGRLNASPVCSSWVIWRCHRSYTAAAELKADFSSGALHPGDLKPALARQLNAILQPVRDHFERDDRAKELLKQVKVSDALPWRSTYSGQIASDPLFCSTCFEERFMVVLKWVATCARAICLV